METLPGLPQLEVEGQNHTFSRELLISLLRVSNSVEHMSTFSCPIYRFEPLGLPSDERTLSTPIAQVMKSREWIECHICSVVRVSILSVAACFRFYSHSA